MELFLLFYTHLGNFLWTTYSTFTTSRYLQYNTIYVKLKHISFRNISTHLSMYNLILMQSAHVVLLCFIRLQLLFTRKNTRIKSQNIKDLNFHENSS